MWWVCECGAAGPDLLCLHHEEGCPGLEEAERIFDATGDPDFDPVMWQENDNGLAIHPQIMPKPEGWTDAETEHRDKIAKALSEHGYSEERSYAIATSAVERARAAGRRRKASA